MIVDHVGKLFVVSISQPGDLARAVVVAATCLVSLSNTSNSAEFGASPYPKGFRDIYAGVVPTVPGLDAINGRREWLEKKIQTRYGFAPEYISEEVDNWLRWQYARPAEFGASRYALRP